MNSVIVSRSASAYGMPKWTRAVNNSDFMMKEEVYNRLGKKRTALYRLIKQCGFPAPIMIHPSKFSRQAVERWIAEGGVNRAS